MKILSLLLATAFALSLGACATCTTKKTDACCSSPTKTKCCPADAHSTHGKVKPKAS